MGGGGAACSSPCNLYHPPAKKSATANSCERRAKIARKILHTILTRVLKRAFDCAYSRAICPAQRP